MKLKSWFLLLSSILLITSAAHAQRLTGAIRGQITDDTQAPLPGVNITLTSEALIGGPESETTSNEGNYRFPNLPPGLYKLTYELQGFQTVVHDQVRVVLGTTVDENVTMNLAKVSEQLVITGETPLIDSTKPGYSTNYTEEYLKNTPIARFTFFDFVQMAPGSSPMRFDNTSFSHAILGSSTNENMYQMDGTDLTSALTGAAWPWPNTDIIQEIELLDLGAPAEYGNYQGAVVNVVTKSGGNEFHGDGNFYWQTQGLTSSNVTIDPDGDGPQPATAYHRSEYRDGTFQIGGPILKDKLWFFSGLQARREHFSQPGTDPAAPVKEDDNRFFFKFTYDVNKSNKLQFSLHNDYYNIPAPVTFNAPLETRTTEKGNNPTPNVMWTAVLKDSSIVEVRYAGFYGHDYATPQNGKYNSGHYDSGYYSGGIISWYDGNIWKSQFSGKYSHYSDKFIKGSHDFRFGVQYTRAGNDYTYAITNGVWYYDYGGYPYLAYFQLPYHIGADINSTGTFADDTWNFNQSLTLNLGVRFDHSKGSIPAFPELDAQGKDTSTTIPGLKDLATWNVVSPRLGFTYKFPWKRATQIRGHYGRYYQAMLTPDLQFVGPAIATLDLKEFNEDTGQYDILISSTKASLQKSVDPNLKDPHTDQFAVGFDRELGPDLALSASYIYKRTRNFIGWLNTGGTFEQIPVINPLTGETILIFNQTNSTDDNRFLITNPSFFHEEYNGFLVSVTKRMTKNWNMTASLTISKSKGFDAGSSLGPADDQDSSLYQLKNSKYGQDPNDYINADGLLNGDRTYIFKLQGAYQLPHDILLSVNDTQMTGRPYAAKFSSASVTELNQGARDIFAETPDGHRRTARISLVDVRVEKGFQLSNSLNVAVTGDIFNLFNSKAFYDVATQLVNSDGFGQGSVFVPPRRVMLGAKVKF